MSLPVFLRGLLGVVVVFAAVTYLITGSVWRAFLDTMICAVLLQVGYFAVVLFLVWRTPAVPQSERGTGAQGAAQEEQPAAEVARFPGRQSSPHP